ncbi:uncharacterized protein TNCV_2181161 [Trichonephila clavipes]|uniref:Uncharacterized protein n=1 Tax=Trichonephila clavipes TaxID=2585209 RepID=A0A8X6VUW5_TRICX|nr:uncharacterized protein TNCV_2181161 [Trichonephila clavipes]
MRYTTETTHVNSMDNKCHVPSMFTAVRNPIIKPTVQETLRKSDQMVTIHPVPTDCPYGELKSSKDISYPTIIRSAIRPVSHGPDFPISSPPDTPDNILDDLDQISHIRSDSDDGYDPSTNDPELFSQSDLNDLVRDLGLPKDTAEVLGSRLKERHLLNSGVSFSWYRFREKEFVPFLPKRGDLVFCNNVPAILEMFKLMYEPEEWRLFMDSSKRSLKAVLLHNGNRYASVPVGHSPFERMRRKS